MAYNVCQNERNQLIGKIRKSTKYMRIYQKRSVSYNLHTVSRISTTIIWFQHSRLVD